MEPKDLRLDTPADYTIQVVGNLDATWADRFGGLTIEETAESLQVSLDIFNFWNLIDDESGHVQYVPFGTLTPISYEGVTEDGLPIYELRNIVTNPEDNPLYEIDNIRSRWRLRFGLRWSF